MTSDFNGPELVAGTVKGIRAFKVRNYKLQAVISNDYVFTPGENIASCNTWSSFPQFVDHIPGQQNCSCGFYAYHDAPDEEGERVTGDINAIVEGYGRVTIGSEGFRAQKLRIVCLINPLSNLLFILSIALGVLVPLTLLAIFLSPLFLLDAALGLYFGGMGFVVFDIARITTGRRSCWPFPGPTLSPHKLWRLHKNYPDIPVRFRWQTRRIK